MHIPMQRETGNSVGLQLTLPHESTRTKQRGG